MSGAITIGRQVQADQELTCDVCIVGSGAGGSVLAAGLCEAGLDVVMLEAGGWFTRRDFDLQEHTAYPAMYQDRATRGTEDLAISVLQGRTVGGSTTVNWTTCFRTPQRILDHWQQVHGIQGLGADVLRPHFEAVEERLSIAPWPEALANRNNRKLLEGARVLGWEAAPLRRNVNGCANSGYCGVGCPVDGKQGMAITYLPDAIAGGLRLFADCEARHIERDGHRVVAVHAVVLDRETGRAAGPKITVRPKVVALSGGAINTPALMLRSGIDVGGRVGRRTFLHPVVAVVGRYPDPVEGFYGAPQSIGSHQFIDRGPDKLGFFLEAAPMQPMLASLTGAQFGRDQQQFMAELPRLSGLIALQVDGLLPGDDGGTVRIRPDGRVGLQYPIQPWLSEGFRAAHDVLGRLHLAAGAEDAWTMHNPPHRIQGEAELAALASLPYGPHDLSVFTAHQMGGCSMGPDPDTSVVGADHRVHGVDGLFVVDGSVLPTALGVNPSQTIYGLAHRAREFVRASV